MTPLILIVEDDLALSNLYDQKFKEEGFNTLIARDGEEGFEIATKQKPDFMLLDMMLPKLTGMQLFQKLTTDPVAKNIPVIFLTNNTSIEERDKAIKLGAKDYLAKAMHSPEDIVNKVREKLGIKSS